MDLRGMLPEEAINYCLHITVHPTIEPQKARGKWFILHCPGAPRPVYINYRDRRVAVELLKVGYAPVYQLRQTV